MGWEITQYEYEARDTKERETVRSLIVARKELLELAQALVYIVRD